MASKKRKAAKPAAKKNGGGKLVARKPAAKRKAAKVAAIPKGYHTATPYLIVRGAARALDFYARAFGAKQTVCMSGPGGSVMHGEFRIGDSMLMISDENVEWGSKSPETLGGSAQHVMLYVKKVDEFVAKAVAAGATVEMPATDMFWGDRYAKIRDPFGHAWSVGTHIEDVKPKEMQKRADAWMKSMAGPKS
jgi:PhnB protein